MFGLMLSKSFLILVASLSLGYVWAHAQQKFLNTGGQFIIVPRNYRASQYDHTADTYTKRKLSDRMISLSDGTVVQRDCYSSFLLYCYSFDSKAIQYDHTADTYTKRKLSDRMISLSDGTVVQRDCYSSFLLYCYSFDSKAIDKDKCKAEFARFLKNEQDLIAYIKTHNINVFNSGI